jgi:anaerobic ribonucleoside-triphosphate reductase
MPNKNSEKEFLSQNEEKRSKTIVFTRTMGYFRPVDSFNDGKFGEHKERKFFDGKIATGRTEEFAVN